MPPTPTQQIVLFNGVIDLEEERRRKESEDEPKGNQQESVGKNTVENIVGSFFENSPRLD